MENETKTTRTTYDWEKQVKKVYQVSKKYLKGTITKEEAIEILESYGVKKGSADIYIRTTVSLIKG